MNKYNSWFGLVHKLLELLEIKNDHRLNINGKRMLNSKAVTLYESMMRKK